MFAGLYDKLDVQKIVKDFELLNKHIWYIRAYDQFLDVGDIKVLDEEIVDFNKAWHEELAEDLVVAKLKGESYFHAELFKMIHELNELLHVLNKLTKKVDCGLFERKLEILRKGFTNDKTSNPVRVATWPLGTKGKNKGNGPSRIRTEWQRTKAKDDRINNRRRIRSRAKAFRY